MNCIKCAAELPEGAVFCHMCGKKQNNVPIPHKKTRRGNGEGTAFKRGNTWTAMATGYTYTEVIDGKPVLRRKRQTKGGFKTKREALSWAISQGRTVATKTPTLLELWEGWSRNDMLKLSNDKQVAYKKARERLEPIISRKIDTLSLDDLQSTINEKAHSFYTARDMKSLLSHLYQRAMASNGSCGTVTVNLSRFIVLPTLEEKEPEPFTEEEVNKMWKSWDGGDIFAGYMLLMIYTSMMPGELFACRPEMIDYNKHEIYGCGRKTKKRKDTPIVFPTFISPVLETLCKNSDGKKLCPLCENKFYSAYHEATKRIGVRDLPPYSCRHTTATEAVKKGVELSVVQQIMRHSKLASTQRYIHVTTEAAHDGVNKLSKAEKC